MKKNKTEYIIVNKTKLLERISKIENKIKKSGDDYVIIHSRGMYDMIQNVLADSTPLEPIEDVASLEDAAEKYEKFDFENTTPDSESAVQMIQRAFKAGAEWKKANTPTNTYSQDDMIAFLEEHGIATVVEDNGRVLLK